MLGSLPPAAATDVSAAAPTAPATLLTDTHVCLLPACVAVWSTPVNPPSLTEPGLFDYLLVNTDLEATFQELVRIAQRVVKGLPPEPGMLPDKTLLERLVGLARRL